MSRYVYQILHFAILLASLVLGLWIRANYHPEWYRPTLDSDIKRPWPVEADCYSRMYRVKRILEGKGLIQNFHPHENYPQGLTPSTTAPLDYCILAIYFPAKLFTIFPLEWAGALVSPLCWVAMALFWGLVPLKNWTLLSRGLLIVGSAISPGMVWATAFGRPDHQSLILALFAIGFTAEYERWSTEGRIQAWWNIFSGVCWGVLLWTSLFEPSIMLGLLIGFNLIVRRRESLRFLISLGCVLTIALAVEGVHIFVPPADYAIFLDNWGKTIGELQYMTGPVFLVNMSFFVIGIPVFAILVSIHPDRQISDYFLVGLSILLVGLTIYAGRWVYYGAMGELMLVARWITLEHRSLFLATGLVFTGSCLVITMDTIITSFADPNHSKDISQPSPEMELLARNIDAPGAIMAPWWLSAGVGYFSDHPIVTGSSHCGIAGIVDGAVFYCTPSWEDADKLLKKHQVRWVVVYDDPTFVYPELNTSRAILGLPLFNLEPGANTNPKAEVAISQQLVNLTMVPRRYHLRCVTTHLKLYEFDPTEQ